MRHEPREAGTAKKHPKWMRRYETNNNTFYARCKWCTLALPFDIISFGVSSSGLSGRGEGSAGDKLTDACWIAPAAIVFVRALINLCCTWHARFDFRKTKWTVTPTGLENATRQPNKMNTEFSCGSVMLWFVGHVSLTGIRNCAGLNTLHLTTRGTRISTI